MTLPPSFLNLAAFQPQTRVLGPGIRAALWVQGCPFRCPGCISPEWIPQIKANKISVDKMVDLITRIPDIQGLTLSGGEPMLQAGALSMVVKGVRITKPIDVICFTGYQYETLKKKPPNPDVEELLSVVDLLIDGPYIASKNNGRGLRGSENQQFIYLTDRFEQEDFCEYRRDIEIQIADNHALVVGIPQPSLLDTLDGIFSNETQSMLNKANEWS